MYEKFRQWYIGTIQTIGWKEWLHRQKDKVAMQIAHPTLGFMIAGGMVLLVVFLAVASWQTPHKPIPAADPPAKAKPHRGR